MSRRPALTLVPPTPVDEHPRRRPWNVHEAARRLPPRCDSETRGGICWRRHPHEAVALQARERLGFGEGVWS